MAISTILLDIMFVVYVIAGIGLVIYGFSCYYSIYLFLKNSRTTRLSDRKKILQFYREHSMDELPQVTTQLPVFNEANCVERLLEAVCAIDYPKDKHEIQVLDDSTDECYEVAKKKVAELAAKGYDIKLIHRTNRSEFKAGALKEAMEVAKGEFLAIFDADFVPEKDFLLKTIPYLVMDKQIGLVQGRWGHLNRTESGLTLAQAQAGYLRRWRLGRRHPDRRHGPFLPFSARWLEDEVRVRRDRSCRTPQRHQRLQGTAVPLGKGFYPDRHQDFAARAQGQGSSPRKDWRHPPHDALLHSPLHVVYRPLCMAAASLL